MKETKIIYLPDTGYILKINLKQDINILKHS